MSDPLFLTVFRNMARDAANGNETGTIFVGNNLLLSYFPASGRFQWYGRDGLITRAEALRRLLLPETSRKHPPMTKPAFEPMP